MRISVNICIGFRNTQILLNNLGMESQLSFEKAKHVCSLRKYAYVSNAEQEFFEIRKNGARRP